VISLAYWLMLMSTIIFFIAEQYLEVGVALAWIVFFTAIVLPLLKFAKYLVSSPRLQHQRLRAVTSTAVIGAAAFAVLAGVPMPERVRVKGVLQASDFRELYSESGGTLVQVLVRPGSWVKAGQPLARLDNPELDYEIRAARRQREQLQAQELQAVSMAVSNLQPLVRQRQAVEEKIAQLLQQQKQLVVIAPIEGIWSASELEASRGQWIGRGASLGTVVDDRSWRFVAVLPQVSTHLFEAGVVYSEIRIGGQQEFNVRSASTEIMPFEQGQLPSAALGMAGGGDIAVQSGDAKGLAAAEPFFRIHAQLPPQEQAQALRRLHGRLGTMRITLPDSPLLVQWERGARQFLQRKFRV